MICNNNALRRPRRIAKSDIGYPNSPQYHDPPAIGKVAPRAGPPEKWAARPFAMIIMRLELLEAKREGHAIPIGASTSKPTA